MSDIQYDAIRKVMIAKTIVENGSVQKAASALKVTPSAVSQSLSALEKKLGHSLFIRDRGALRPTEECLALLERAAPAFEALGKIFPVQAKVRIDYLDLGTYESLAYAVLPSFVRALRRDHPRVKLNLMVSRTTELLKKLRSGELCSALVVENDETESLRRIEVAQEELGIFVNKNYLSNFRGLEALNLGYGFLSVARDGVPAYMRRFLKQLGPKPLVTMTSDSFEVLRVAAVAGIVASILPKRVAKRSPELAEITELRGKAIEDKGLHRILLVTLDRCDQNEAEYLAKLARLAFKAEATSQPALS